MKLYKLRNNIYRVNNETEDGRKTLEYTDSSMENEFRPVEDFNDFTINELITLADYLGQYEICSGYFSPVLIYI
jgi:hypothetical protein